MKLLDWGEDGHRSEQDIAALRAAFSQEVSVWHKLDHPNVTKVLFISTSHASFNYFGLITVPSTIKCMKSEQIYT